MSVPIWFTYHVPKTGGQTLRDHLVTQLGRGVEYEHLGRWNGELPAVEFDDVVAKGPRHLSQVRVIGGHPLRSSFRSAFPGRPLREVVVIRDPAERIVSHYNWKMTEQQRLGRALQSFEDYVDQQGTDYTTRFLCARLEIERSVRQFDQLVERLTRFWLVCRVEGLDLVVPYLLAAIGLDAVVPTRSNVTGVQIDRFIDPDPNLLEELRRSNPFDMMLHRIAGRLERRFLAEHAAEVAWRVGRSIH